MSKHQNKTQQIKQNVEDLSYEILLIKNELKNCTSPTLGESLFNELNEKQKEREFLVKNL